ncbi:MAG: ferredoxin III, nif-specific [Calditerrivibrio sp.]|nr:ferredoxin III, nif-specific [Calditerrivibrio sp.]
MSYRTYLTKSGGTYIPQYVISLDKQKCIGCGRCFKACPQNVFELVEDEDEGRSYMTLGNDGNCIGCMACNKACPKGCLTFARIET